MLHRALLLPHLLGNRPEGFRLSRGPAREGRSDLSSGLASLLLALTSDHTVDRMETFPYGSQHALAYLAPGYPIRTGIVGQVLHSGSPFLLRTQLERREPRVKVSQSCPGDPSCPKNVPLTYLLLAQTLSTPPTYSLFPRGYYNNRQRSSQALEQGLQSWNR